MSKEEHTIRNPIIATVVSGIILAILVAVIPGAWAWLKSVGARLGGFLTSTVALPGWLLVIMILAILPTVGLVVLLIDTAFQRRPSPKPTWFDYREDIFDGIVWRWNYTSNNVDSLLPYCPNDDTILVWERGYRNCTLFCETCRARFGPFEGERDYILGRIERQIERKVRTGEWRQVVKGGDQQADKVKPKAEGEQQDLGLF